MQRVQLYVEDQLVDLFQDETIEVTSTIQDIRDIGKVFTDYSQTFSVPASNNNNKIFKHFYNYFITSGAFDSRQKKEAKIFINYIPFRSGKIFLNNVKMKNNKPYSYEIIFYGKTVSLKDLIGDDELIDLSVDKENDNAARYLSNYNHEYNETNVKSGLVDGIDFLIDGTVQEDAIIYPLITSKKRLYYDSSSMDSTDTDGNLYHDSSTPDQTRGLKFTDLKPAIKVLHIIEAIEDTYNINFTRDFFEGNDSPLNNLYMWINNKRGEFNDVDDDENKLFSLIVNGYDTTHDVSLSINPDDFSVTNKEIKINVIEGRRYRLKLHVPVVDQDVPYDIILRNKTNGAEYKETVSGNTIFESPYDAFDSWIKFNESEWENNPTRNSFNEKFIASVFEFEIRCTDSLSVNPVQLDFAFTDIYNFLNTVNGIAIDGDDELIFDIIIKDRLPNIKVIDFLTGIFKMFNLTAYYIDDESDADYGKIYVDTLDNFYADAVNNRLGGTIDIDKYLDTKEHDVSSVLPFTDIDFEYEETNTVLMRHHYEQFAEVFGNSEFNVKRKYPNIDRGDKYNIKLPFSHFKYERLLDSNLSASDRTTLLQWGYCAGGDFSFDDSTSPPKGDYDTISIKPLLFYGLRTLTSTTKINWISTTPPTGLTNYYKPSNANTVATSFGAPQYNLNFDQESNEWEGINYGSGSNSLYNVFYKSYIEGVLDPTKRMFKVTAYLPPNIIINYRLNDQIKIQDMMFRINSITTNLNTGKSEIELLNIKSNEIVE